MTRRIAFVRHGPTTWNEAGRIQGWTDVGLSERGKTKVAGWRVPSTLRGAAWVASPLLRAVQTAYLLGATGLTFEPRLMEMQWGGWEGKTLADLRAEDPTGLATIEARGLDFQPPGGESPRLLQRRVAPWLAEIAGNTGTLVAVTHKGVIRAIVAKALDWDMTGPPPVKLDWSSAHLFQLRQDGTLVADQLNLSLRGEHDG
jgi:probable phosphoglycerate mutase